MVLNRLPRRVIVQHQSHGCESGCCGHIVLIEYDDGDRSVSGEFEFTHEFTALREQAQSKADELGVPFDEAASEFVDD